MPVDSLLIGLAVVVALLAVVPAGRRLIATGLDIVDGSVAMFAIRRALGRDTTTARQRRIDRRHAAEQAEILRRIGGPDAVASPPVVPAAPTRLVVSGGPAIPATTDGPRSRRLWLRDGAVAAVGLAIALVTISTVVARPTGGVLGATASPRDRTGVTRASADPAPSESSDGPASPADSLAPTASPAPAILGAAPTPTPTPAPIATDAPVVDSLTARLTGTSAGGRTVAVELAWDLAAGSPPATGFDLFVRVDDRAAERIAALDGDARSFVAALGLDRTSTFHVAPTGAGGSTGESVAWAPITPGRHQESSSLATQRGTWRTAEGPSLSGGGVTYSRDRGATLTFRFRGTDVGWVATRTPASGRAQVRIDGEVVRTVDLDAGSVRYRRLVFRHHLPGDGQHVLEIRALGDGRVDVDAFVVLR